MTGSYHDVSLAFGWDKSVPMSVTGLPNIDHGQREATFKSWKNAYVHNLDQVLDVSLMHT